MLRIGTGVVGVTPMGRGLTGLGLGGLGGLGLTGLAGTAGATTAAASARAGPQRAQGLDAVSAGDAALAVRGARTRLLECPPAVGRRRGLRGQ